MPFIGARHTNVESDYEYGSRAGMWRLMRVFSQFNYPFTCFAVGMALEKNPDVAKACISQGHEIAGHGYRWLDYRDWAPEDEKESIKQCIKAITATSGVAPVGWFVGRGTPNSVGVVWEAFKEMGLPLKWESDAFNDDVPYWVDVQIEDAENAKGLFQIPYPYQKIDALEGLLILPYTYETNDMKFVAPSNFGGNDWETLLKNTFDMLYEEGGKMMSIGIHPRLTGKPGRTKMLQNFLKYINKREGVWVTTRGEIAEHFRAKFPYNRAEGCSK